jgi:hypothetical protein
VRQTAQALTAISTSPAAGFGGGNSVIASGRCGAVSTWARIGISESTAATARRYTSITFLTAAFPQAVNKALASRANL